MPHRTTVSAAEIIRNFGFWQEKALGAPVAITHHGRERLFLVSPEYFTQAAPGEEPAEAPQEDGRRVLSTSLSAVLDNVVEGFVSIDASLNVVAANRVAEAYFGRNAVEAVGRGVTEVIPSLSGSFALEQLQRVLRTGEPCAFEMDSVLFPGRRIGVRMFPYPAGVAVLFHNLTELEDSRRRLREWDACLSALDALPQVARATLDGRGLFVSADAAFCRLTGFDEPQLLRCKLFDILALPDRRRVVTEFEQAMRSRAPIGVSAQLMVKDRPDRPVTLGLAPIVKDFVEVGAYVVAAPASPALDS